MKQIILLLFCCITSVVQALPFGYKPVTDPQQFKDKFTAASRQIQTVSADFTQVKQMNLVKDKMVSKGRFYYKQSDKVRIEYQKPFTYLMILNGHSMKVKDEQKESTYNTHSNKMMESINNIMLDCMSGHVYQNRDFTVIVGENPKEFVLEMTPGSRLMKNMFAHIDVYLSKSDYHVLRLNLVEPGGDNILMTFTSSILNQPVDDKLFKTD